MAARSVTIVAVSLAVSSALPASSRVAGADDFYRGKTITVLVS
ncbi:MAG: hypothetical protein ACM30I_03940 [Gemmatimonas sp.]